MNNIDIKAIKGAIFDVDGTLLDSMSIWEHLEEDYLISCGITPRPGIKDDLRTLGGLEVPLYFQSEYGLQGTKTEIRAGINRLAEDFYHNKAQLKKGVYTALEAMSARGIKMCVATATDRCLVEPALRRCGVLRFLERIFTCGEEKTGKRSPEIFVLASVFLGTDISETLVVEDALHAMITAKSAGFPVAAVYDRSADDQKNEIKASSDVYLETMDEIILYL